MKLFFLFVDGIGLGEADPDINPFAREPMPELSRLLDGAALTIEATADGPLHTAQASLLALDPNLGIPGLPQSASGQACLMTGVNVPEQLGYHFGPKPNSEIAAILRNGNLFGRLKNEGRNNFKSPA